MISWVKSVNEFKRGFSNFVNNMKCLRGINHTFSQLIMCVDSCKLHVPQYPASVSPVMRLEVTSPWQRLVCNISAILVRCCDGSSEKIRRRQKNAQNPTKTWQFQSRDIRISKSKRESNAIWTKIISIWNNRFDSHRTNIYFTISLFGCLLCGNCVDGSGCSPGVL